MKSGLTSVVPHGQGLPSPLSLLALVAKAGCLLLSLLEVEGLQIDLHVHCLSLFYSIVLILYLLRPPDLHCSHLNFHYGWDFHPVEQAFPPLSRSTKAVGENYYEKRRFVKRADPIPKMDMTSLEAKNKIVLLHERGLVGKLIGIQPSPQAIQEWTIEN